MEELVHTLHALSGAGKHSDRWSQLDSNDLVVGLKRTDGEMDHIPINHMGIERSWHMPEGKESGGQGPDEAAGTRRDR